MLIGPLNHCVDPLKENAGNPVPRAFAIQGIGTLAVELLFLPDLSTHVVKVAPFVGVVPVPAGSLLSNQSWSPLIELGEKDIYYTAIFFILKRD
jgi:hypothetical protein